MDTVAERDGDARLTFDVELVGVLERARVAGRGAGEEEHGEAGRDGATLELAVLDAVAALVLRRRPVPEDLLDRAGIFSWSSATFCHWSGFCQNSITALPTSFVTVSAPAPPRSVAKPVISTSSSPVCSPSPRSTVTWVRRDSMSSPGFLRFSTVSSWKYIPVSRTACVVLRARLQLARIAVEAGVEPLADLLALAVGHAEQARDHLDGEQRGEVRDRVEPLGVAQRVEEAADDVADHGFEGGDGAGREHATDQRTETVVLRRIHHDDAPEARDLLRVHREREQLDAVRAREALPVAVRGEDVGEARQRVEPVLLAEVDRRFVAEPPVDLGGIVEELIRERIEPTSALGGLSPSPALGAARRAARAPLAACREWTSVGSLTLAL